MKQRHLFAFISACLLTTPIFSQTTYTLQYKSPYPGDTTTSSAFFLLNNNGTGIARINYVANGQSNQQAEMSIRESYPRDAQGEPVLSQLQYTGLTVKTIKGDSSAKPAPVKYWFTQNKETGFYEPWAVTDTITNLLPAERNFISSQYWETASLTRSLLKNYFDTADAFFSNLYGIKTRGGSLLSPDQKKTRILFLLVGSTYDSVVGPACLLDTKKMIGTITRISDSLGLPRKNLIIDTVFGSRYNHTNVVKAINKLKPVKGRDIVIFYYSGHGFTNPLRNDYDFPFIDLRDPRQRPRLEPRDSALNIEDIYTTLKNKGGMFTLVLSDCCNNKIDDAKNQGHPQPRRRGGERWSAENIKSLFIRNEPLSVLMTAASKGEKAWAINSFGSFFTDNFLNSLTTYIGKDQKDPVWPIIMSDAQESTIFKIKTYECPATSRQFNNCNQTPKPKIN